MDLQKITEESKRHGIYESMGLAHTKEWRRLSRRYDFYRNSDCAERMDRLYGSKNTFSFAARIIYGNPDLDWTEINAVGERVQVLLMLDLFGEIDGGDVALDYVNRLLTGMGAQPLKRSEILRRRLSNYEHNLAGDTCDYFEHEKYTDEEIAEVLRFADREPDTFKGRLAAVMDEIDLYEDVIKRQTVRGCCKNPDAARFSDPMSAVNYLTSLYKDVGERYAQTGELSSPKVVADELIEYRKTDFHFEDKNLEIKLKTVLECGLELSRDRVIDILDRHKPVLRKEFFTNVSTVGELTDPWESEGDDQYYRNRNKELYENICTSVRDAEAFLASGDVARAEEAYDKLSGMISDEKAESRSLPLRKLVCRTETGFGDLYSLKGDPRCIRYYEDAAELAEMILNSEKSDAVYRSLSVIYNKLAVYYDNQGDVLNTATYRNISASYAARCGAEGETGTDINDVFPISGDPSED